MEVLVKVTSSFPKFEELGASVRIDVSSDSFKSSGHVGWAPARQITGDVSYDKSKAAINVGTPFPGYQTIKV